MNGVGFGNEFSIASKDVVLYKYRLAKVANLALKNEFSYDRWASFRR